MPPTQPEFRYEPLRDEWTLVAPARARRPRPAATAAETPSQRNCPFCPGNEAETPPEVAAERSEDTPRDASGWTLRVVPNKYPAIAPDTARVEREFPPGEACDPPRPGTGVHEVVIETETHSATLATLPAAQLARVLICWRDRMRAIAARPGIACVHVFRNEGRSAGATIDHPHSQILATPIVPRVLVTAERAFQTRRSSRGDCLLCSRIAHEIDVGDRVVAASVRHVAFCPHASRVPYEICVTPRDHAADYRAAEDSALVDLADLLGKVARALAVTAGPVAFNLILQSAPIRRGDVHAERAEADDTAPFHWFIELLPRSSQLAGFEWASGSHINDTPAEIAARELRGAIERRHSAVSRPSVIGGAADGSSDPSG